MARMDRRSRTPHVAVSAACGLAVIVAVSSGLAFASAPAPSAATATIVVCAPGYPGSTEDAKPTMALFARAVERAAGRPQGSIDAIYHESEEAGVTRIKDPSSALALVTLPFYSKHAKDLSLTPELQVIEEAGPTQVWTLVARKGSLTSPASLAGWEITGTAGFAPVFVRETILGDWGPVPDNARITFTATPLSALRRASSGNKVAVILDGAQSAALATLPFAAELESVVKSKPVPGTILCEVGDRLDPPSKEALLNGLKSLPKSDEGKEALKAMRMVRFEVVDAGGVKKIQGTTGKPSPGGR